MLYEALALSDNLISPYELVYTLSLAQFIALLMYFYKKGMYVFEVPKDGRELLILRSILYCASFALFTSSLEGLNPVTALMMQHIGLLMNTIIIRVWRHHYYKHLIPSFILTLVALFI